MFLEWFFNIFNLVISFSLSFANGVKFKNALRLNARPLDSRKLNDKVYV